MKQSTCYFISASSIVLINSIFLIGLDTTDLTLLVCGYGFFYVMLVLEDKK